MSETINVKTNPGIFYGEKPVWEEGRIFTALDGKQYQAEYGPTPKTKKIKGWTTLWTSKNS